MTLFASSRINCLIAKVQFISLFDPQKLNSKHETDFYLLRWNYVWPACLKVVITWYKKTRPRKAVAPLKSKTKHLNQSFLCFGRPNAQFALRQGVFCTKWPLTAKRLLLATQKAIICGCIGYWERTLEVRCPSNVHTAQVLHARGFLQVRARHYLHLLVF